MPRVRGPLGPGNTNHALVGWSRCAGGVNCELIISNCMGELRGEFCALEDRLGFDSTNESAGKMNKSFVRSFLLRTEKRGITVKNGG